MEIWKPITGFEEKYRVSNYGKVKSIDSNMPNPLTPSGVSVKKGVMLKQWDEKGYFRVGLRKSGEKPVFLLVHRIVAKEFVYNENKKPHVNHIDGNTKNNHFSNLEWVTPKENVHHAINILKRQGSNKKVVLDLFTGIFYDTSKEAFMYSGGNINNITTFRKKIRESNGRFIYVF